MLYNLLTAMVVAALLVWGANYFSEQAGQRRTQKLLVKTVIDILMQGVSEVAETGQIMRVEKLLEAGRLLCRQKHRDLLGLYPGLPEPTIIIETPDPELLILRCTCGTESEEVTFNGLLFQGPEQCHR